MLADRIRKRHRHLRKWAKREQVTCYRVYDRDIPEQPLMVDFYEGRAAVYAMHRKMDSGDVERERWLTDVESEVAAGLDIPPQEVYIRERRRLRGRDQYRGQCSGGQEFAVREGGYTFLINLLDYHDTGLFLDHRQTRRIVEEAARGCRVLNLFCYTGSFSVYAAGGGAVSTTSLDLSRPYLEWTRRNLEENNLAAGNNRTVQADVMTWLGEASVSGLQFDLVVCDPPTFSNSKRMRRSFDVQRDQTELISRCLHLLTPTGTLYFSCNRSGFRLEEQPLECGSVTELTSHTVPEDFRDKSPHQCWALTAPTWERRIPR